SLVRPRPPPEGHEPSLVDLKRHVVERLRVAVEDIEVVDAQHHSTASAPRYDCTTAGSRTTASGAPSAIAAPWCNTSTRAASAITARMTCSIRRMVSPDSRLSWVNTETMRSVSAGRNPAI